MPVKLSTEEASALIDCGATWDFVSKVIAKRNALELKKDQSLLVELAVGSRIILKQHAVLRIRMG